MDRPVQSLAPRRRKLLWLAGGVLAALLLLFLAFVVPPPGSLSVHRAQIQLSTAAREPFQDYLPIRAEVAPAKTVYIDTVSGGQVERMVAADGAEVAAGDVLAILTNPQLTLDVSAREAEISGRLGDANGQQLSLQTSRADRERGIAEAENSLLKANHELSIRQKLHDLGYVSDTGLKPYLDEAAYARDRVQALKAGRVREDAIAVGQAAAIRNTTARLSANLKDVESSLQALTIRAPVKGRLTNFTLQPGQTLKTGDQVGQIDSEGDYKLTADVDEFYLGRVAVGLPAQAEIDGATFNLTISRVLPQVTNGRFRVELIFPGKTPPDLKRGQSVDLRITFGRARPELVLDNGPWLEAGGGYAFVLQPGGRQAKRQPISVGRRNPEQVEVTSGLQPGDRVVTSSYAGFEKYQRLIFDRKDTP